MKTRRGICHQPSEKAPVSFCDVVDSFSEEEWKLLQLWQKELYNNLMKELQQAFSALGPFIATLVFSLKPKVKEDSCSLKLQDLDTMENVNLYSGDTSSESDMFGENQYLKGSPEAGEHESFDDPNAGAADMAAAVSFSIKSEEEMYSNFEKRETTNSTARLEVTVPIASIGINEVGEIYPFDMQDDPREESSNSHLGKGNLNRKRNMSNPFSSNDNSRLCKTQSKKLKTNEVRIANQKNFVSPAWPVNDCELQDDIKTQSQSGFHQQVECSLQNTVPYVQPSEIYDDQESKERIDNHIPCENRTLHSSQNDESYQKDSSPGQQQAPEVRYPKIRYPCTECGKTFLWMSSLIMHQRIHTGERPFLCTICGKRFTQKGDLHRHQQVHTGARPYRCNVCQKTFTRKCHLHTHERRHIITKIL